MAMYSHAASHFPGWHSALFFVRGEVKDTDQVNRVFRSYDRDSWRANLGMDYPLTKNITGKIDALFQAVILRKASGRDAPESGAVMFGIHPEISTRAADWDGFLLSEKSASLGGTYLTGLDGEAASHVTAQTRWEQSLIPGFRLNLKGGLLYSPMAMPLFAAQPSSVNVDILPSGFAADHYAGASAGLEKYLLKVKYGTLSVLAAYQAVYSSGPVLGVQFDHGVMAALRFYLARLAIPAVGLGMSYNVPADHWQGYFSIGMGF
jgi:hypothetical protein